MHCTPTALATLTSLVLLASASTAEIRCLSEPDDGVLVQFETGDPRAPVVSGEMWKSEGAPPEGGVELRVRAPRALAWELLAAPDRVASDRSPGSVLRGLVEDAAAEIASAHRDLEALYEASFVDEASGSSLEEWTAAPDVGGGVFQADLEVAIQQMEAYADLLSAVSESVEAFAIAAEARDEPPEWLLREAAASLVWLYTTLCDPD